MRRLISIFLFLLSLNPVNAQTGPGGIGNSSSNGLWLIPESVDTSVTTAVSSWPDISGNGNDAGQSTPAFQPQRVENSFLNSQSAILFDGSDQMQVPDAAILDGTGEITFYTAIRFNNLNGSPRGILGKRISSGNNTNYAYTWFLWGSNLMYVDINLQNDRFNTSPLTYSNNVNYMFGLNFDGSRSSSQRVRIYDESTIAHIDGESSTTITNSNQPLTIGALNENYGTYLGAYYGDVIHFNYSLDSLGHIIVQNYLSAKYEIALTSNDLYLQDNNANGDYDFDVCGIGRIDASTIHDDSKGNSIVRILNPGGLGNNEFLFWGHNGQPRNATEYTDIPFGVEGRFHRIWRVNEVDGSGSAVDVGSLEFRWDLSSYTSVTAADIVMLVDTDNDGIFSDETPITGATHLGGGIYSFTGITSIANNLRFTLGSADTIQTPLPVTLTFFTAEVDDQQVAIKWITASEINNDYFEIQRSQDLIKWNIIAQIEGAGNSSQSKTYTFIDENPLRGYSYYRLKQVDYDGKSETFEPKAVFLEEIPSFTIFPNPIEDFLNIRGTQVLTNAQITILDLLGRKQIQVNTPESANNQLLIDVSELKGGLYFVEVLWDGRKKVVRVVKN